MPDLMFDDNLQNQDFKVAYQLCSELVDACFPPAWEVCRCVMYFYLYFLIHFMIYFLDR